MSKSLLETLVDAALDPIFKDPNFIGKRGESLTARELKLVDLLGRKGKILRNIYIPKENGDTSEIDLLYITQKGIFVIESKNYSGWIFGDEKSTNWTASLPNGQKNRFYNPILQNKTHIKWLNEYLGGGIPLFSLIVFSERCELKKVTLNAESNVKVIKRDYLYANIRKIWNEVPDVLTDNEVEEFYAVLKRLTNVGEDVKIEHIESIKKRYERTPAESQSEEKRRTCKETAEEGSVRTCPKCGSPLVLRTVAKGENAGKQFYGCSQFPKCWYKEFDRYSNKG